MTTAQRTRELAAELRTPLYSERDAEIATGLEYLARMLEAALPDSIAAIRQRDEYRRTVSDKSCLRHVPVAKDADADCRALLDAYRVLAARVDHLRQMNQTEHEQHNAARIARQEQLSAARAEVERLKGALDLAVSAGCHANAEAIAEKQRADRLADLVRAYRKYWAIADVDTAESVVATEEQHGHLVPRE